MYLIYHVSAHIHHVSVKCVHFCLKNDSSEQLTIKIVGILFSSLAAKLGTAVWVNVSEFVKVTRLYVFNETSANFQLILWPSPVPCLWQQNSNFMQIHDVFVHLTKWNLCLSLIRALAQCCGKTELEKKTIFILATGLSNSQITAALVCMWEQEPETPLEALSVHLRCLFLFGCFF